MIEVDGEEYLTAEEAARLLGVKVSTLYAYASRGTVPSYRLGRKRQRLYRRADVDSIRRLSPGTASRRSVSLPRAEDWVPYT